MCEKCGERVLVNSNNQNYCKSCSDLISKELAKERLIKYRNKNKNETV